MGVGDDLDANPAGQGHRSAARGGRVSGQVSFASVVLVVAGCVNLSYGIAAILGSHVFTPNAHQVFGDPRSGGWITLIIGLPQLLAAAAAVLGLCACHSRAHLDGIQPSSAGQSAGTGEVPWGSGAVVAGGRPGGGGRR